MKDYQLKLSGLVLFPLNWNENCRKFRNPPVGTYLSNWSSGDYSGA